MKERYIRNIPSIAEEEQTLLASRHVFIAGCGGLGGYLLEYLLRLGIGHISIADGDCFEESNLNRQLLSEPSLNGTSKAEAAAERAALIAPEAELRVFSGFIDKSNAAELIKGADAVMDALDSAESRLILSGACKAAGIPLIHGAVSGWTAQAAVSMPGDGLIDTLYSSAESSGRESTLSFTPALCAAVQASLCLKLLCGRPVESGKLYCIDLKNMDFDSILFS